MARIRSIKPEFWTDRSLARKLSRDARMLYLGLWNLADEHARLNGDAYYIKGQIFPYDDDLTPGGIDNLLDELDAAGKAVRYTENGDPYLFLPTLHRHQRLEADKVPSRMPAPPDLTALHVAADAYAQVAALPQIGADKSARDSDLSVPGTDELSLLYVAGSREHVAGSREHVPPRADSNEPATTAVAEPLPLASLAEPPVIGFAEFWNFWPRKVKKPDALRAWDKAVGKKRVAPADVVAAVVAYAERCQANSQDVNFIPYPATWLNAESWNDDLDAVMPLTRASPPTPSPPTHETYKNPDNSVYYTPK